ncbi:MAG: PIN domain-containing protein [Euryarchaeota archaeon]|nr:PIN domain-containing protein [Euryarchaeota archaeon]
MIFMDSSLIIAYANKDDENHGRASTIMEEIVNFKHGKAIISDLVFSEIVTVIKLRKDLKSAVEIGEILKDSKEVDIVFAKESLFEEIWSIFRSHRGLSFVDASNIAVMKTFDIKKIATFDRDFENMEDIEVVGN